MKTLRNAWILGLVAAVGAAQAQSNVPTGTEVMLRFQQAVNSRTAKPGDSVKFVVAKDVYANGHVALKAGTPVRGVIETVNRRDRFGKNARIRLALNPVHGITLEPRDKGKPFSGSETTKAAAASGAGALLLGPLGLAGGYFITGKSIDIHPGDTLRTEVSKYVAAK